VKKKTLPAGRQARRKILLGVLTAAAIVGTILLFNYLAPPREKAPVVKIYFFKGDKLAAVERPLGVDEAPLPKAITELLSGPKVSGLSTQIPPGTKILRLQVKNGTAILDFNRKLEAYGGGSARVEGMIAQIVYTATEVPGITKVWIWINGNREVVLGGEGLVLDRPLSRRDISN